MSLGGVKNTCLRALSAAARSPQLPHRGVAVGICMSTATPPPIGPFRSLGWTLRWAMCIKWYIAPLSASVILRASGGQQCKK